MKRLALFLLAVPAFGITVTYGVATLYGVTATKATGSADIVITAQPLSVQQFEVGQILLVPGESGYKIVSARAQVGSPATTSTTLTLLNSDRTAFSASGNSSGMTLRIIGDALTHTAVRLWVTTDVATCAAFWFDTTTHSAGTGTDYAYRSSETAGKDSCYGTVNAVTVTGLAPDTTYYVRANAKTAKGTNNAGACNGAGCGATEFSFKTAAETHDASGKPPMPTLPEEVASWVTTPPDTSGYTVVSIPPFADGTKTGTITSGTTSLVVNNATGMATGQYIVIGDATCPGHGFETAPWCKITNVSGTTITLQYAVDKTVTGGAVSWAPYTLQTLIGTGGGQYAYGTVFELDQGYKWKWYGTHDNTFPLRPLLLTLTSTDTNAGCAADPSPCSIDDPAHRWIVFRTKGTPGKLPPVGVRTGPEFESVLGGCETQDGTYCFLIDTGAHHIRFENMAGIAPPVTAGAPDPEPRGGFLYINSGSGITLPKYIVMDRILSPMPTNIWTRKRAPVALAGQEVAILNSYLFADYWRPYDFSVTTSMPGNSTIAITSISWQPRSTVTASTQGAATVTASGTASGTVHIYGYMDYNSNGVSIQYTSGNGITITCPSCGGTITANATPQTPITATGKIAFHGVISSGSTITCTQYCEGTAVAYVPTTAEYGVAEGSGIMQGFEGDHWLVQNNYLEGYGVTFFVDIQNGLVRPPPSHVVIRRNKFYMNQDHRTNSSTANGFIYQIRHLLEVKRGTLYLIEGNEFEGSWARVNQGPAIALANTASEFDWPVTTAMEDFTIRYNKLHTLSESIIVGGHQTLGRLHGKDTARVYVGHNLAYDLDWYTQKYVNTFFAGRSGSYCGHDIIVEHNLWYDQRGSLPVIQVAGDDRCEGVWIKDNAWHMNWATFYGMFLKYTENGTLLMYPPTTYTGGGVGDPDFKTGLDSFMLRLDGTETPNYTFANNTITCGWDLNSNIDMNSTLCNGYRDKFGAALVSANFWPAGSTRAAREAAVAWANTVSKDFRLAPTSPYRSGGASRASDGTDIGPDIPLVEQKIGQMTAQATAVTGSGFTVVARVPDSGASCTVAYGTTSSLSDETAADTTASRQRSIAVTGLSAGIYYWQLWCAGTDRTPTQMVRIP